MLIKNNRPGIIGMQNAVLEAGVNSVPSKQWEEMKKHPTIQALIEDGTLEEIEGSDDKDNSKQLGKMKPNEAKSLVKATTDQGLLEQWLQHENRAPVKKAIQEQMRIMAKGPEYFTKASQEAAAKEKSQGKDGGGKPGAGPRINAKLSGQPINTTGANTTQTLSGQKVDAGKGSPQGAGGGHTPGK